MKRIYKLLPIVIIGMAIILSCEKDKPELTYTGSDFIAFQDTLKNVEETASGIIEVIVMLVKEDHSSAVTVGLSVSSPDESAVEGTHYDLVYPTDGQLNFPAGKYTDTIQISVIDNADEDGAKTLQFELASIPDGINEGMPGPDNKQSVCQLLISDNDCAFISSEFTGPVSGVEFFPSVEYPTAAEFTLVDSTESIWTYEVTGIMASIYAGWGETVDPVGGGTGSNGNVAIVYLDFTDPINPSIYFEEQNLSTTDGGAWIYDILNDPDNPSKFSTCNKTIELYYLINISEPGTDYGPRSCYIKGEFLDE